MWVNADGIGRFPPTPTSRSQVQEEADLLGANVWLEASGKHHHCAERPGCLRFDMYLSSHDAINGFGRSRWVEIDGQVGVRPHEQRGRGLDDRRPVGHDDETRPGKA
jgi:hypothetical protein